MHFVYFYFVGDGLNKVLVLAFLFLICFANLNAQNINVQKYKLAESYEKSGDFESAVRLYSELIKSEPNNDDYFDSYARSLKTMNKFAELLPRS